MVTNIWFNEPLPRARVLKGLPTVTVITHGLEGIRSVRYRDENQHLVADDVWVVAQILDVVFVDSSILVSQDMFMHLLGKYVSESAFASVSNWMDAIRKQVDDLNGIFLYFIRVTLTLKG